MPTSGTGNSASAPLFVEASGGANLRLRAGSPGINAGSDAYGLSQTDLDGNPRISGDLVDIGAYEYQSTVPLHTWLAQYNLPADGSSDYEDTDHDGLNNWQEWIAGTSPANITSALRMLSATDTASGVKATWSSVSYRSYSLERATNAGAVPAFSLLQSNIVSWTDTNTFGTTPRFYRVRVENRRAFDCFSAGVVNPQAVLHFAPPASCH